MLIGYNIGFFLEGEKWKLNRWHTASIRSIFDKETDSVLNVHTPPHVLPDDAS